MKSVEIILIIEDKALKEGKLEGLLFLLCPRFTLAKVHRYNNLKVYALGMSPTPGTSISRQLTLMDHFLMPG